MRPILKLYRGYANEQELMGHVFKPTKKKDYDFLSKKFKKRLVSNRFISD
jgi:hypothetical protein